MIKLAVVAMIISVALKMADWQTVLALKPAIVMVGAFSLFYFADLHPALVIILAGLVGIFVR